MTGSSAFSTESCYGTIELTHFSGVGIGRSTPKETSAMKKRNNQYNAQVYFVADIKGSTLIHIPVFWDLEIYQKVVVIECITKIW
jgi:hypothetical protein